MTLPSPAKHEHSPSEFPLEDFVSSSFSSNHSHPPAVLHFLQKLSCLGTYQEQLLDNLEGKPTMLCFGEGSWRSEKAEALKTSRGLRWRVSRGISEKRHDQKSQCLVPSPWVWAVWDCPGQWSRGIESQHVVSGHLSLESPLWKLLASRKRQATFSWSEPHSQSLSLPLSSHWEWPLGSYGWDERRS